MPRSGWHTLDSTSCPSQVCSSTCHSCANPFRSNLDNPGKLGDVSTFRWICLCRPIHSSHNDGLSRHRAYRNTRRYLAPSLRDFSQLSALALKTEIGLLERRRNAAAACATQPLLQARSPTPPACKVELIHPLPPRPLPAPPLPILLHREGGWGRGCRRKGV